MSGKLAPLFKSLTHGVYIIGVGGDGDYNAFTAAWVMQVSFSPLLLALSINPRHSSYQLLKACGGFTVNVLLREQSELAMHFGQPAWMDKLASVSWRPSRAGSPILLDAHAWFECEYLDELEAGDHRLVVSRVADGGPLNPGEPMIYRDTDNMDGSRQLFPDEFPLS